jgi:hypothetical protein
MVRIAFLTFVGIFALASGLYAIGLLVTILKALFAPDEYVPLTKERRTMIVDSENRRHVR